jgi:hypothetical protein
MSIGAEGNTQQRRSKPRLPRTRNTIARKQSKMPPGSKVSDKLWADKRGMV